MKTSIGTDISLAADFLRNEEIIGIPTETVYGLAANALNADAVLKVFETKGRPLFNPLIVHVKSFAEFEKYAAEIPPVAKQLAGKFSPGPLTFVLPKKKIIPDIVTGGGDTVALRIPAHPLTQSLLNAIDFPLAAPSANPFGYISPVTAEHVQQQLGGKIPYILDGGKCEVGVESTVIGFETNKILLLRFGGITLEQLKESGEVEIRTGNYSNPQSPGQLKSHYAPKIPLHFGEMKMMLEKFSSRKKAVLSFQKKYSGENIVAEEILSPSGNLHEAASNLFSVLRKLDASKAEIILAEKFPEEGLGLAINDRLMRAAG